MRKTAITLAGTTAIGLCLGISAGSAADMALPMKAAPVVPFTWTGCYVGVQAGIGAQTDGFANITSGEFDTFGNNGANGLGAIAGGQIGCNYQISQLVVGIEGDGVSSGIQNTSTFANSDGEGFHLRTRNLWDADVALRVGAAFDRLLVYGKGGVAWGGFDFRETPNSDPAPAPTQLTGAARCLASSLGSEWNMRSLQIGARKSSTIILPMNKRQYTLMRPAEAVSYWEP